MFRLTTLGALLASATLTGAGQGAGMNGSAGQSIRAAVNIAMPAMKSSAGWSACH